MGFHFLVDEATFIRGFQSPHFLKIASGRGRTRDIFGLRIFSLSSSGFDHSATWPPSLSTFSAVTAGPPDTRSRQNDQVGLATYPERSSNTFLPKNNLLSGSRIILEDRRQLDVNSELQEQEDEINHWVLLPHFIIKVPCSGCSKSNSDYLKK